MYNKVAVLLFMTFWGCVNSPEKANDPKARLEQYMKKSFSVSSMADKEVMLSFLTGEVRARLGAWSEEQFRGAFIESKRKFLKLAIKETKEVSPGKVSIVYELTYLDEGKGKDAKVTNRKLCELDQMSGTWYISKVTNIKELIEYQSEMALP